jgi:hypothetical protein
VAEGGGLLNRYTLSRRIEGSNPSVSASSPQDQPRKFTKEAGRAHDGVARLFGQPHGGRHARRGGALLRVLRPVGLNFTFWLGIFRT